MKQKIHFLPINMKNLDSTFFFRQHFLEKKKFRLALTGKMYYNSQSPNGRDVKHMQHALH